MLVGHLPELIIILVIAVLFVGPGKLPSVGGAIGRSIREFKRETGEIAGSVQQESLPGRERTNQD